MENTSQAPVYQPENMIIVDNLAHLSQHQFVILDSFLPEESYQSLLKLTIDWYAAGKFRTARVGNSNNATVSQDIRRDQICWLNEQETPPALNTYYNAMNTLLNACNREFYLGLTEFETHFAVYQPGDFYRKHVDQFKNTQTRRISCVYYLNPHWDAQDGGELQLYDQQNNKLALITPLGNRLVCFDSTLPHEVYPTHKTRYSITGWFKTRSEQ